MGIAMALADLISEKAARRTGEGAAASPRRQALLIVLMWACVVVGAAVPSFSGVIDRMTTDDAMRLVEVRDLLAGQSWFDLTQHRLNPPDGVIMHWSRVIDLPIALILGLLQTIVSSELATKLTLVIWPGLLLLPTLFACASASRTLAGSAAATIGPLMLLLSPAVTGRFAPGAIDHHGAQVALALTMLACALQFDRSRGAAVGAGVAAALMLAIGMETLPHLAAISALIALRWGVQGAAVARGARVFGLSFAVSTAFVAVTTLAPSSWSAPVCDALGIGHLVAAAVGGIGLWTAATFARDEPFARFAALGAIAVLALLGVAMVSPDCFASPYANLPEAVKQGWLINVQEARPFFAATAADPTSAVIIGLPLLALAGVAAWAAMTADRETAWPVAIAVAAFAAGCAVTLWQIRGSSLAYAFGGTLLPMAALAIGRTGADRVRLILGVAAFSPITLALLGLGVAQAANLPPMETSDLQDKLCPSTDYQALARLQPGLALNPIDTGPFILVHSGLSTVAGPYHRDVDGLAASLEAFDGQEEAARAVAVSRRAAYVVVCGSDGGVALSAKAYPDGFSAKLLSGAAFDWLEPIDLGQGSRVKAWRVLAGRR